MADCNDIDAALANLASKINDYAQKLNALERLQKQCCDKKEKESKDIDLSDLTKRVAKLEKNQEAIKIGIVESLNNFADIESVNADFALAFQGLHELINPMLESVSLIVDFLKG